MFYAMEVRRTIIDEFRPQQMELFPPTELNYEALNMLSPTVLSEPLD